MSLQSNYDVLNQLLINCKMLTDDEQVVLRVGQLRQIAQCLTESPEKKVAPKKQEVKQKKGSRKRLKTTEIDGKVLETLKKGESLKLSEIKKQGPGLAKLTDPQIRGALTRLSKQGLVARHGFVYSPRGANGVDTSASA